MEYNKKIKKSINNKFIKIINSGIKSNIGVIKEQKPFKHFESSYLIIQSAKSLDQAERLLRGEDFIDSNILVRSSLEYLMMVINIQYHDDAYDEFINLNIKYGERDITRPERMISKFKTHLNEISEDFFKQFNGDEKKELFQELYNKLCFFTHGSLYIVAYSNIKTVNVKEIFKYVSLINIYFLKLTIFLSMTYFSRDKEHNLKIENVYYSYLLVILQIAELMKEAKEDIAEIKKYLYIEKNNEYFEEIEKGNKRVKDFINDNQAFMDDNKDVLIEGLITFLK